MILRGAQVFVDGQGFAAVDVRTEGEHIAEIGTGLSGDEVLEVSGYLVPGFIDVHTHGFFGHDTMYGAESALFLAKAHCRHGVTSFLPTTVTASIDETASVVRQIASVAGSTTGARILGMHLEGPFLSQKHKGAQVEEAIVKPTVEQFKAMCGQHEDFVRMLTLAPEVEGADAVIQYAAGRGIVVSAGHTAATYEEMVHGIEQGVTHVTHLFNAMTPIHHRLPGVPTAALLDDRVSVQLIPDGVHLHPAILRLVVALKPHGIVLVTDSVEAAGLEDGTYALGGQEIVVRHGEARLHSGNLAGSTLSMDEGLRRMMRLAGLTLAEVLPMVTTHVADLLGRKDLGRIAVGALADLCLLDEAHMPCQTMVGGRLVQADTL